MEEPKFPDAPAWANGFYIEIKNTATKKAVADFMGIEWVVETAHTNDNFLDILPRNTKKTLTAAEAFTKVTELKGITGVTYAEPLFTYCPATVVANKDKDESLRATYILGMDRPELKYDWHLELMRVKEAWELFKDKGREPGEGVVVGHTDTGYTNHPEIADRLLRRTDGTINGRDFLGGDEDPMDELWSTWGINIYNPGHATGTGSVIVSPADRQGKDYAHWSEGVAPGAQLMPLRVTPMVAMTNTRNLADAIRYAIDNNIPIVSASLGAPIGDQRTERILEQARANGVIVCVAAGNVVRFVTYPGSSPNVLTVAGCTFERDPWFDSCRGEAVDVTAGAASVWVAHTKREGNKESYMVGQGGGTSFAVAAVAGLAALWLSYHGRDVIVAKYGKDKLVDAFHYLIRKTATTQGKAYFDCGEWGTGIPNALALLKADLPALATIIANPSPFALTLQKRQDAVQGNTLGKAILTLTDITKSALPPTTLGVSPIVASAERHQIALQRLLGPTPSAVLAEEVTFHLSVDSRLRTNYIRVLTEADAMSHKALREGLMAVGTDALKDALKDALDTATKSASLLKTVRKTVRKTTNEPKEKSPHPLPTSRRLRVYAFDPSLSVQTDTLAISEVTLKIPWEIDLKPGPVGEYIEVVDIDPASGCVYPPVNLNDPALLAQDGLAPSEGYPHFHQQMAYTVAMETIQNFEKALGRRIIWRAHYLSHLPDKEQNIYIQRLRIYPHALREANAYYSPARRAILMGYFPATASEPGEHYPNGLVFTCLSQDIVAHEMTHAILDGVHPRFAEPTNGDVLAFHEAFADIVALFQRFSQKEVLRNQIAKTRGDLRNSGNLLGQLAQQFGRATGGHGALRQYVGKKADPYALETTTEPHERGAILVAAVFDAFLTIYQGRIADLLRLATGGSGILPQGELHPDLVNRLAQEASKSAGHVLTICVRALDYCPPVDITFGEYLRALITADYEWVKDDERGYRVAFIEAFRKRGIYPRDVRTLSEETLRWKRVKDYSQAQHAIFQGEELLKIAVEAMESARFSSFANPDGRDSMKRFSNSLSNRKTIWEESREAAGIMHNVLLKKDIFLKEKNRNLTKEERIEALTALGLEVESEITNTNKVRLKGKVEVHSVRSLYRVLPEGGIRMDLVIEMTQWRRVPIDPKETNINEDNSFIMRGGVTIVYNRDHGEIRYIIRKNLHSKEREERQRAFSAQTLSLAASESSMTALRGLYFPANKDEQENEPFAIVHRGGK
jgi:hypothetical protein